MALRPLMASKPNALLISLTAVVPDQRLPISPNSANGFFRRELVGWAFYFDRAASLTHFCNPLLQAFGGFVGAGSRNEIDRHLFATRMPVRALNRCRTRQGQ